MNPAPFRSDIRVTVRQDDAAPLELENLMIPISTNRPRRRRWGARAAARFDVRIDEGVENFLRGLVGGSEAA